MSPSKVYHPETWFHFISGNIAKAGITADISAIAEAGFSGIQLFHGYFNDNVWPGVEQPIKCLSPLWEDAVRHTAQECQRHGLRFTMQNCPGWAMAGGPWIETSNAMRHLVASRTDVTGDTQIKLPRPQPSDEDWRDYKDVAVIAFPTPEGDTDKPLQPLSVTSNRKDIPWLEWLREGKESAYLPMTSNDDPHWVEVTFPSPVTLRTLELTCVGELDYAWCYEPGTKITIKAILKDGSTCELLSTDLPQSNWQDDRMLTLACPEVKGGADKYRIEIVNSHGINLNHMLLFSAARKNNWEAEAGWTLRSIERKGENPKQSDKAFVHLDKIVDISSYMDANGNLNWTPSKGKWTILRIGHVNTGQRNGPASAESSGWECDKLSKSGSEAQYANYIGHLAGDNGPVNGMLCGMLMDSWECKTQTWTPTMEEDFYRISGYPLRKWLPAVFGYVVDNHETTTRFLRDWRRAINKLLVENFFGNMASKAHESGISISYETACGDIFPGDIMEYYKYADVPMCEFWQPLSKNYVGSINFKPVKPTASAAHMYGKPRVAAEAFTSFAHTWDEHLSMLKEVANINYIEGVSHLIFHTYTHNPQINFLPPGTSFGGQGIGTPFLRGQTWWKHMPAFTSYLARCGYMLERGKPVSDVLWYLGDEMDHKPDQNAPFPKGYKYDYCNPDALITRLSVKDGTIVTPEGISYRLLWIPENRRMLPETLEKIHTLVSNGATIVGNAPKGLATLTGGKTTQKRFDAIVKKIWGGKHEAGVRKVGNGRVISGRTLDEALAYLDIAPDVKGGDALWAHRKTENTDWYFVCSPEGKGFSGTLDFRCTGDVELWDPETGKSTPIGSERKNGRTSVALEMPQSGSCFIVFRNTDHPGENPLPITARNILDTIPVAKTWQLSFPDGWGAPASLQTNELKAWKDLDMSAEAKAFSGTVTYTTTFNIDNMKPDASYRLHLGRVEMIAAVTLNGKPLRTVWAPPYEVDITDNVRKGSNSLVIDVTSTWYNRLAYDAGQEEGKRKTWAIHLPKKDSPLLEYGLMGPVFVTAEK